jgi:hypothetical protein
MTKKFGKEIETWVKYGVFHYRNSNFELARKLLVKSLNSLEKRDRKKMILILVFFLYRKPLLTDTSASIHILSFEFRYMHCIKHQPFL